jgi:pyridoxamine 5'-phosphate oxidase
LFSKWFADAKVTTSFEPNAMVLSTVSKSGAPKSRFVLLKDFSSKGFTFFTNSKSNKGAEISKNKNVALLFYWKSLHRQIRIEGSVKMLPTSAAKEYFYSRPKSSQIASYISQQSRTLQSRQQLDKLYKQACIKFKNSEVPFPKDWRGYIVIPNYFEFWSGMPSRLHDRASYKRLKSNWKIERLFP